MRSLCQLATRLSCPRVRPWAVAPALLTLACAGDLPQEERIASTRVLAVRVEVPGSENEDGLTQAEALPLETVQLQPWIVTPDGPLDPETITAQLDPTWLGCLGTPRGGLGSCLLSKLPLEASDVPSCPLPMPGELDPEMPEVPEVPSPCRLTEGTPARPEITIPLATSFLLGGDLEVTMIASSGDTPTGRCARTFLQQQDSIPDSCLLVTQRVAVGPDAELLRMAAELGVGPDDLGAIPEDPVQPDRNLLIRTFRGALLDPDGTVVAEDAIPFGGTLTVEPGQSIEMLTTIGEQQLQSYPVPVDDEEFELRDERVEGRWFTSWGDLLSEDSQAVESTNRWTLEPRRDDAEEPPEDGARLYYVVRDGRLGVDWWWFQVRFAQR